MLPKKKLLFLFSDTGGGHRSSCEAVEEAIHHLYPDQFEITKVDFLKSYAPWPFYLMPIHYNSMHIFNDTLWSLGFKILNYKNNYHQLINILWPYIKKPVEQIIKNYQYDLLVSFHPIINYPISKLEPKLKYVLVITDLVTAHSMWYSGNPVKYFAPTQEIKNIGTKLGVKSQKIEIAGLPISLKFKPKIQTSNLKFQIKTILLMGGGQGLGKIYDIAKALNSSFLPIKLIVIAGRNQKLENHLHQLAWRIPHEVYGFRKDIPALMQEADVLLTKAGPSTICEGLVSGLPIIVYDYLKGQETANVDYLVKNHAGLYCPTPKSIISALKSAKLDQLTKSAQSLANPHAALDIARGIYKLVS